MVKSIRCVGELRSEAEDAVETKKTQKTNEQIQHRNNSRGGRHNREIESRTKSGEINCIQSRRKESDLKINSNSRKRLGCAIWGSLLEPDKPASKGGSRGEKECLEKSMRCRIQGGKQSSMREYEGIH